MDLAAHQRRKKGVSQSHHPHFGTHLAPPKQRFLHRVFWNQEHMKEHSSQILVDYLLMVVCLVVGIRIWGGLITAFDWIFSIPHPYLIAAALLGVLNTGHFFRGFFYTDPDISDIPTRGLMTSYFDLLRIGVKILAFITIGPSVYLRRAIEMGRTK